MREIVPPFRPHCPFLIHLQEIIVFYENACHLHGFLQKKGEKRLECPIERFILSVTQETSAGGEE